MLQMPEDSRSIVVEGSQYEQYGFPLDALTLEPSDICSIKVKPEDSRSIVVEGLQYKNTASPI